MRLPDSAYTQLAPDLPMCRMLNGMWQVSGGHGRINSAAAVKSMSDYLDAGFTTWDLADHYGPAEDFIGEFKRQLAKARGPQAWNGVQAFTKWVPQPGPVSRRQVEEAIAVSLRRMDVERLDLLQFHWWDYDDPSYLDALKYLAELRDRGRIRHIALTNFDTRRLEEITSHGIRVVSNQVQYSLIDRRPEVRMAAFCQEHDIRLLTYGTLAGGLLSERYLGKPEPSRYSLDTVSLKKYKQMQEAWGSWELFQELLRALKQVADRCQVSIANVAVRWVLDRAAVGGVIVGARLGLSDNRADNARVFALTLDSEDRQRIDAVHKKARDLFALIGDCGDEYRR